MYKLPPIDNSHRHKRTAIWASISILAVIVLATVIGLIIWSTINTTSINSIQDKYVSYVLCFNGTGTPDASTCTPSSLNMYVFCRNNAKIFRCLSEGWMEAQFDPPIMKKKREKKREKRIEHDPIEQKKSAPLDQKQEIGYAIIGWVALMSVLGFFLMVFLYYTENHKSSININSSLSPP